MTETMLEKALALGMSEDEFQKVWEILDCVLGDLVVMQNMSGEG